MSARRGFPAFPKSDIDAQAAWWVVRLDRSAAQANLKRSLELWLEQSGAHRAAYEKAVAAFHHSAALRADPDMEESVEDLRNEAASFTMQRIARPGLARILTLAAAALVFIVGITALMPIVVGAPSAPQAVEAGAPEAVVVAAAGEPAARSSLAYETAVGEQSMVNLPDGSVVELDTDTRIRIAYSDNERRIILLGGQGLFKVFHDPSRPFIVVAGPRIIRALGTEFTVVNRDDEVAVTLLEGRVEVSDIAMAGREAKVEATPAQIVQLDPGQRLRTGSGAVETVSKETIERELSWREGRLSFDNQKLDEVVREMNRYSMRKLELANPDIAQLRISGSFKAGSVDNFAAALGELYPLEARKLSQDANRVIIDWQ